MERLEILLEACYDGVIEVDAHGVILLVNSGAERLFGYRREQMLGQRIEMLVPMASREAHFRERTEYQQAPRTRLMGQSRRLSALRSDGTEVPVNVSLSPVVIDGERHTLAVVRDVSEAAALSDALAMIAAQSRTLFDATPVPLCVYDTGTLRFLDVNEKALETYGYTREEFLAMSVPNLRGPGEANAAAEPADGFRRHVRKDGTTLEILARRHPIPYEGRSAHLAVLQDITDRRKFEAALEEALARAESASRAKSEFLAGMSHELRSPLHTIIGFSELLSEELEGPMNEKQKRFVQHIQKDSQHLLTLINDILDLSKIEAGRMELRLEAINAATVIEEAVNSMRPQADAKDIRLEALASAPKDVVADRTKVHQILVNLLSNAIKFTPSGGSVLVDCKPVGRHVEFSVTDTGIGVPVEYRESIFDVFYQVSATTKGVREGTGLGLAICRRLVEQQGGAIWVDAAVPPPGSVFRFTLPSAMTNIEKPVRAKPVVLVLEDDPGAVELMRNILEAEGYAVTCVESVRDTLIAALNILPDVILLDLLLPNGSGRDALRSLKGIPETSKIPVAVISVLADESILAHGADAFLTKPFQRERLRQTVANLCRPS
jgi:PAS domain S-box-containing protein